MIEQKLTYTAPEAEVLVVRFESQILTASGGTEQGNIVNGAWD